MQNRGLLANTFISPQWPVPEQIVALTTTRVGGVSQNGFTDFNLAEQVGDQADRVAVNRQLLAQTLEQNLAEPLHFQWLQQVHSPDVVEAGIQGAPAKADGVFSHQPQIACCVLTADCLPVLLTTRQGGTVAAVHAGWRGLAAGVLENAVQAMQTNPEQILVWLGPAIGPCHFEVGAEVRQAFLGSVDPSQQETLDQLAFTVQSNKIQADKRKYMADLYAIARHKLKQQGVTSIHGGGYCTFCSQQQFYSYRRQAVTGRMASLIYIRS